MPMVPRATKMAMTPMTTRQMLATMAVMVTARAAGPRRIGAPGGPAGRGTDPGAYGRLPSQLTNTAPRRTTTTTTGLSTTCCMWRAVALLTPTQTSKS